MVKFQLFYYKPVIIKFYNAKNPTSINLIVLHFIEKNNVAEGQMEQDVIEMIDN